jgi:CDP-diacylglycerol pyrophosphatase
MRRLLVALGLVVAAGCMSAASAPDALHRIVASCLDTEDPRYCARCPSPQAGYCRLDYPCSRTTQVWVLNQEYVAIRDLKMCGCPAGFVHGLVLPRFTVTGVEDPRRPDGIWPFAWDAALLHIPQESEIALAVNPPELRTQDQLHVHLVRLAPGARVRLAASSPARAPHLDLVWDVAARDAAAKGLASYGVLVMRDDAANGFLVITQRESPEYQFTATTCR